VLDLFSIKDELLTNAVSTKWSSPVILAFELPSGFTSEGGPEGTSQG
jgi:hypothetical protein